MLRIALVASLVGLLALPAYAQTVPTPPVSEPVEPADATRSTDDVDRDPTKMICRNVRPPTGTRVSRGRTRQRMCMSRADWEQQERDAQDALKVRDSGICSPGECRG